MQDHAKPSMCLLGTRLVLRDLSGLHNRRLWTPDHPRQYRHHPFSSNHLPAHPLHFGYKTRLWWRL